MPSLDETIILGLLRSFSPETLLLLSISWMASYFYIFKDMLKFDYDPKKADAYIDAFVLLLLFLLTFTMSTEVLYAVLKGATPYLLADVGKLFPIGFVALSAIISLGLSVLVPAHIFCAWKKLDNFKDIVWALVYVVAGTLIIFGVLSFFLKGKA